ncbi:MAG TPA: hypothetical protein VLK25_00880 [Allosphingosinicella sp.]|nr:hypothetical protein [Allosphingosinicella sp.]
MNGALFVPAAIALLAAACAPAADNRSEADGPPRRTETRLLELDLQRRALAVPVDTLPRSGEARFVVVEVARIENEANIGLTFAVAFRPAGGTAVPLGTFSLYPADNPGRFIVATQGRVRPGGAIVVTMQPTDPIGRAMVRVGIRQVALADR